MKDFAQCLPALPNLHTLEITSMENTHSQLLCVGLMTAVLPQIRTAILPPAAHHILRHCPNIEDLTCSWEGPNRQFFESLAVGKMKLKRFATLFPGAAVSLRRFAALLPGEADSWASEYHVHTVTSFAQALCTRIGRDLPSNRGIVPDACETSLHHPTSSLLRSIVSGSMTPGMRGSVSGH